MGGGQSRPASASSTRSQTSRGCLAFPSSSGIKCDITIALLGLDNAGKTSTVLALAKEDPEDLAPTVGFNTKTITVRGQSITLYDLGGGPKIRAIWKSYLAEVHGIVYVVDAADTSRIEESAKEFGVLCSNPYVSGKPMLILANKSDKEEALSEYELTETMNLEDIVNINMIPTKVQASTTMSKDHATLKAGMKWLYMAIASDWSSLNTRVTEESTALKEKQRAEKRERMDRLKRERAEREASQNEENDDDIRNGDPFQSLGDHLSSKDKEAAAKKTRRKSSSRKASKAANKSPSSEPENTSPAKSASGDSHGAGGDGGEERTDTVDGHVRISPSPSDSSESRRNLFSVSGESAFQKPLPSHSSVPRAPSPRPSPFGDGLTALPSRLPPIGGSLPPLNGATPLKPIDSFTPELSTKKKKRKKKARIIPSAELPDSSPSHNGGLLPVEEESS